MSIHNRAAYQRINPNMSLKPVTKPKTAYVAFKSANGVLFKEVTTQILHQIAKHHPELNATQLLIAMINGKSIDYSPYTVSIVFK